MTWWKIYDTSNFDPTHPLYSKSHHRVLGKMKSETGSIPLRRLSVWMQNKLVTLQRLCVLYIPSFCYFYRVYDYMLLLILYAYERFRNIVVNK